MVTFAETSGNIKRNQEFQSVMDLDQQNRSPQNASREKNLKQLKCSIANTLLVHILLQKKIELSTFMDGRRERLIIPDLPDVLAIHYVIY